MKAEIIRGNLIAVDGEELTIGSSDYPEGKNYESEGLNIDEEWVKTWLGGWADWVIIGGVIKSVRGF